MSSSSLTRHLSLWCSVFVKLSVFKGLRLLSEVPQGLIYERVFCIPGLGGWYLEGLIHGGAYFRNFKVATKYSGYVNSAGCAFLKLDCFDFDIPVYHMEVGRCLSCDKYLSQVHDRLYARAYKAGFVLICSALGTYKVLETWLFETGPPLITYYCQIYYHHRSHDD